MKHPIFHPDEPARIGPYASDRRLMGQDCTIRRLMLPVCGEHRYGVRTEAGMYGVVLESTLQKRFQRSDWGMLKNIWQPRRAAR